MSQFPTVLAPTVYQAAKFCELVNIPKNCIVTIGEDSLRGVREGRFVIVNYAKLDPKQLVSVRVALFNRPHISYIFADFP